MHSINALCGAGRDRQMIDFHLISMVISSAIPFAATLVRSASVVTPIGPCYLREGNNL